MTKHLTSLAMPKRKASSNSGSDNGKKRKSGGFVVSAKAKREIVFDPEARKAYLRGFSERKRQRRVYGLAMQKVKDRKAKLEERKQTKKDELKRVEEAEQQKAAAMDAAMQQKRREESKEEGEEVADDNDHVPHDDDDSPQSNEKTVLDTKTYDDQVTEAHWGGRVTVTTSAVELDEGDSSDDDDEKTEPRNSLSPTKKSADRQQQYAGNVEKYMTQLKGNMPGKKTSGQSVKRKGKNGAAGMKGIGGAANLKIAQKVLTKVKSKTNAGVTHGKGKHGKKKSRR